VGWLLLVATALTGLANPTFPVAAAATPANYQLSIRDQIQLIVYDEPDLSTEQRIDGRGQVRIPLIGTTRLAGMTVREAEEYLERAYVEQQFLRNPMVSIRVADYSPKEVDVLGAVVTPGKLTFPMEANSLDIVDVISRMGGFTGIARSNRVRVTRVGRDGRETDLTVNVERMITGRGRGAREQPVDIFPGDVIWVPERLF
jgi:polysaccharide export outer membrane protein